MRIIVHGQQAFGKSVLEALLDRGEDVIGVYCAPDAEGRPPDPIKQCAEERGLPVHQPRSYRKAETAEQMASLAPDLCVMAYVTAFVPEAVLNVPVHGSIQYHPSLLPRHRGGSSINWPIIWGETRTGLSIFWPDDGLDEGPILMQKEVEITGDDTLGSLYFDKLFPLGVEAMLESVNLVRDGKAPKIEQDHSRATYEGWCRGDLVRINWHMPTQTDLEPDPRLQPRAGRLDHLRGRQGRRLRQRENRGGEERAARRDHPHRRRRRAGGDRRCPDPGQAGTPGREQEEGGRGGVGRGGGGRRGRTPEIARQGAASPDC